MSLGRFIGPMLLTPAKRLPEGPNWSYELKLDGFRALAIKSGGRVQLRSRNNKDFNGRYPAVAAALGALPDDTVVDGEVIALDEAGKPAFNLLQNFGTVQSQVVYYVFDALVFGRYDDGRLTYAGRTRSGFTPAVREKLSRLFRGLECDECPFVNLLEAHAGRWGQGLTADKMAECRWLRPVLVADFEFVEWTPDGHLRDAAFVALKKNLNP